MSKRNIISTLGMVVGWAVCIQVFAGQGDDVGVYAKAKILEPDLENGKEVYAVCAPCHLHEGWGLKDGTYPQIAGQHRSVLIQQLSDIHSHNRDNPTMYPFALPEAIGDEHDIADVAGYIEKMKMTQDNGKGDWSEASTEFEHGKNLFHDNCAECHGPDGAGDPNKLYPKIQGQHYKYILRQMEWMREGKRRDVNHSMLKDISGLTASDISSVANYISRIPVPKEGSPK